MSLTEPAAIFCQSNQALTLQTLIERCSHIAMLPAAVVKLLTLVDDVNFTTEELIDVISLDPAIAVRLLKVVNSPYHGMSGKISTIKLAVMLLGSCTVKNIAIAASLVKHHRGGLICPEFDVSALWTHSIAVATAAMMLARETAAISPDEAFLGGLIHDIGIFVEIQVCAPNFVRVIQKLTSDDELTFRMVEEELIGVSHELIGSAWCEAMNLPRRLQIAVGYHHRPLELDVEDRQLPTLIHIADVLAAQTGLGYTRTVDTKLVDPGLLHSVMLTEAHLKAVAIALPNAIRALVVSLNAC